MRIISQSGLLDVPYELIAISPYSGNMATMVQNKRSRDELTHYGYEFSENR